MLSPSRLARVWHIPVLPLALFTGVRGREILGSCTSDFTISPKFASASLRKLGVPIALLPRSLGALLAQCSPPRRARRGPPTQTECCGTRRSDSLRLPAPTRARRRSSYRLSPA